MEPIRNVYKREAVKGGVYIKNVNVFFFIQKVIHEVLTQELIKSENLIDKREGNVLIHVGNVI